MSRARALATNMAAVISGKALASLAGLLTIMVLTRHLGPTGFGYYRTVLTFAGFGAVLADCGLYMVTLHQMSRPGGEPARVLGNALPLRIASTAIVLLGAAALVWVLPYERVVKLGTLLGAAVYVCFQASDLLIAAFQSVLRQARNSLAEITGALVTLAAVWCIARVGGGVLAMLFATLLGALAAVGVSVGLARRLVPFRVRFEWPMWRQFIAAGLPIAGSQILNMAMLRGNTLLLSLLQPAAAVGLFGVPAKLFELSTSIPYVFAGLMMPSLTSTAGERERWSSELRRTLDVAWIYGLGVTVLLAPFASEILTLLAGPAYASGAAALRALAAAAALAGVAHALRFTLVACGVPRAVLKADAVACLLAVVAYGTLIPRYGVLGAACGSVIAEAAALAGLRWGVRATGRTLPGGSTPLKALLAAVLSMACMRLMTRAGLPWPVALCAGATGYLLLLLAWRAIPRDLIRGVRRLPSAEVDPGAASAHGAGTRDC